jgi:hypothetical protein
MPELSSARTGRLLAILLGWSVLLGLLAACFWAYLQPDFLLELISNNLLC